MNYNMLAIRHFRSPVRTKAANIFSTSLPLAHYRSTSVNNLPNTIQCEERILAN